MVQFILVMPQNPDRPILKQFKTALKEVTATYICPGQPSEPPHDFQATVQPIGINILPQTHMCPEHHRMGILADSNLLPHT